MVSTVLNANSTVDPLFRFLPGLPSHGSELYKSLKQEVEARLYAFLTWALFRRVVNFTLQPLSPLGKKIGGKLWRPERSAGNRASVTQPVSSRVNDSFTDSRVEWASFDPNLFCAKKRFFFKTALHLQLITKYDLGRNT